VALALLAAGSPARGGPEAFIQAPASALVAGQHCQLRVQVPAWERPGPGQGPDLGPDPGALPWVWSLVEGPGAIEPSGRLEAPEVAQPVTIRVRARLEPADGPALQAERLLLVLPFEPFDLVARVREPFGLARVAAPGPGGRNPTWILVSDPGSHVIRMVSETGTVTTPWGEPDQPGFQDPGGSGLGAWARSLCRADRPGQAEPGSRFRGPTFLHAAHHDPSSWDPEWRCLVSDSGNHAIRVLRTGGNVATLAGSPGQAGHHDSILGCRVRFNDPQGLAEDSLGNLYVADRGNHVIRRITPGGGVGTLAGAPGEPGTRDGQGRSARFSALRGLAIQRLAGVELLHAVDGHAIRRITLPEAEVTTPLGVVATPGFEDATGEDRLRRPCLNRPCGLEPSAEGLLIADEGNHCLRVWCFESSRLTTCAGTPGQGETRWGLVWPDPGLPLDDRFASLASPRTLVRVAPHSEAVILTTGAGLAGLHGRLEARDSLGPITLDSGQADLGHACAVTFSVDLAGSGSRPIHYTADFLEPDGTLAERVRGTGRTSVPVAVQAQFSQRGAGAVVVRCVTDQGVCAGIRKAVEVR
jgi:hypothetical protein